MSWVGLDNYVWLFTNPSFYNALWKTFTIGVLSTVPQLALALGLAHLLNYRLRGRTFLRVAMLMPYATSVAAATLVFALIFGRDAGLVNGLLGAVGIDPVDWRNGDWTAQIAISVIVIWRWTGYNALIYLAGMQSIPATCTRRRRSTARTAGSSSCTSRCPGCGRRSCSRSSSRRSAPASSSASRCCSAAGRPTAARRTSTRRWGCSCTSRAGSSGSSAGRRRSRG